MFKVGDRVITTCEYMGGKTGILEHFVYLYGGGYWIIMLDKPTYIQTYNKLGEIVDSDIIIEKYTFSERNLSLIEKRERVFNLEIDPYGEENWYE